MRKISLKSFSCSSFAQLVPFGSSLEGLYLDGEVQGVQVPCVHFYAAIPHFRYYMRECATSERTISEPWVAQYNTENIMSLPSAIYRPVRLCVPDTNRNRLSTYAVGIDIPTN
jgi:hypothetical protein